VAACSEIQTVNALGAEKRGFDTMIVPALGGSLADSTCIMCGQCIHACPVGAIYENEQIDEFLAAIADPDKIVVTQIAPAVRVAIAELVEMNTGDLDMEVFVNGLRQIGLTTSCTQFTADLTFLEEGFELLLRLTAEKATADVNLLCPGW
jgi:NADH-quinone oxidoreductase subunit G